MNPDTVSCINCETVVNESKIMIDRQGQFPELNLKAEQEDKDSVKICQDCYKKLTGKEEKETVTNVRNFL